MPSDSVSYQSSGYFTPIIVDYLNKSKNLRSFYNRYPDLEAFEDQIAEKSNNYDHANREVLVTVLEKQYATCLASDFTRRNINLLRDRSTFTVTTGHQLNLFSGPLYFLYKIVSAINLAKTLTTKYPDQKFVPIYWMATEDHDFDEINHFHFNDQKIAWERDHGGPVGRFSTAGLEATFTEFSALIGLSHNADVLKQLFETAYLKHSNLATATRFLANELFGEYGLVVLDGDDPNLKALFATHIRSELTAQLSSKKVQETIAKLSDYKIQVAPREINLFYITDELRERIIYNDNLYLINNTDIKFTREQILTEVQNHPERFSPNVIMRPLYEEVILPNLCYIGGGGEIAYWLELKSYFEASNVAFPILLLRNSVLLVTQKQANKAANLNLSWSDLFKTSHELLTAKIKTLSNYDQQIKNLKTTLSNQFDALYSIAENTDKSFSGAVKAQHQKQIKGLEKLEKRLLVAEKHKYHDELARIQILQNELFPNQTLQERKQNFSVFYEQFGQKLIEKLIDELEPLSNEFKILVL